MLAEKSKAKRPLGIPVCSNNKKRLMKGAVKMCEDATDRVKLQALVKTAMKLRVL
jgi:hypothetical protein